MKRKSHNGQIGVGIAALFLVLTAAILFMGFTHAPPAFFFILILSCAVFGISFINIDFALIILIFSMLLSPEIKMGAVTDRNVVVRVDDIFLFFIFFGWLARMAVNKELGLLRTSPLNKPIIAYIFLCVLATAIGVLRQTTKLSESVFYLLKYVEYFVIYFMVSNNIRNAKQARVFTYLMLLTCFIVGVYALYTYKVLGMRATAPFEGTAGESNTLSGYLLLMMGITLGLFLYSRSIVSRLFLGSLFLFTALPFMFTLSRGGWFGFVPMYMSLLIFSKRGKGILLLFLVFVILASPVIFPKAVTGRVQYTFSRGEDYSVLGKKISVDESTAARIKSWQGSLKAWSQSPIFGHGVPGKGVVSDVQYTRVLREVGIIGFLAFLWIISGLFRTGFNSFRSEYTDDFGKGLSVGFIGGLVGLMFSGVAAEVFIIIRIMEPFWFLAAMVAMLPEVSSGAVEAGRAHV